MEREVVQTDADRYVIVEYLAEGGMGAIFLGKKVGMEGFEKEVVLKQLLPEFTSQPEFIDLFLREARLSAALDHANIVHTIDLVAAGDDYFIVMEYVRGGDLRTILRRIKHRGQRLHAAAALFIAREVLGALAYAHDKKGPDGAPLNLIHRDVSPSNIMLSGAGEVKLADFGIAKVSTHKSVFYRVKGKVGYMSPEQAHGNRPLDRRSDLYSVAVCLHEMLSGERLFVADLLSTPQQIYSQKVPRLEQLAGIPAGIDDILVRALANDPDHRYQNARELQDALVHVAYRNEMLFTTTELSSHLRRVCGSDPSQWNIEQDDDSQRPGTELLPPHDEDLSAQFSHLELTSVFSGPSRLRGATSTGPRGHSPSPGGSPTSDSDPWTVRTAPEHPDSAPYALEPLPTRPSEMAERLSLHPVEGVCGTDSEPTMVAGEVEDENAVTTRSPRPLLDAPDHAETTSVPQTDAPDVYPAPTQLPADGDAAQQGVGRGAPRHGNWDRHQRRLHLMASALLLLVGVAIAIVVGLTGPDLDEGADSNISQAASADLAPRLHADGGPAALKGP